jgi:outer membrane immunogenic protein
MMMFRASVFCAALLATAASASADGYRPGGREYYKPFSWTGLYVGGVASYNWGSSRHCDNGVCLSTYPVNDFDGFMGGVTVGYNHQFGNLVAGVEGDWQWGNVKDSATSTATFNCGTGPCITELQSLGTVRGRLGYAIDRVMPYVTAGVAFADYHVGILPFTDDHRVTSFTVGAGVEFALAHNFSAKIEYLYVDGGDDRLNYPTCGAAPNNCFVRVDDIHSVRLGLNYKFGRDDYHRPLK